MSFVRRERPPSAGGHLRSESRGSGRNQFTPQAFDGSAPMQMQAGSSPPTSNFYQQHTDFAMGHQSQSQQPSFNRPNSYGNNSYNSSSSGGVKLPAAVNYSPPPSNNEGLLELRNALTREIEYRRHLENEVAQLKDVVGMLLQHHDKQMQQAAEEPDHISTTIATPSKARPRSPKPQRPVPPPQPSPQAIINLTPVLPVSTKVLELEEKFNENQQQEASRHTTFAQQLASFETSLSSLQQAQSLSDERSENQLVQLRKTTEKQVHDLESKIRKDAVQKETDNTQLHEQHANTFKQLTSTIQLLQTSLDQRDPSQLKSQVDSLSSQLTDQSQTLLRLPKQFTQQLFQATSALSEQLDQAKQQRELETAATSAILKDLSKRSEEHGKNLDNHIEEYLQQMKTNTTRFRHIEEAIRAIPQPDPNVVPRVNNLYVQLDRLEQTVEALAKQAKNSKPQTIISKPQTPANSEAEDNMRAIRAAIGTVDAKITESNQLNTALHDRMNGLDTALLQSKKTVTDLTTRVKTLASSTKETETTVDQLKESQKEQEARMTKLEGEWRVKESKERERKRVEKAAAEKEETTNTASTTAASLSSTSTQPLAATSATPTEATDAGMPDAWKAVLEERWKRERTKTKLTFTKLEQAITEATTSLTTKIDAVETTRKKEKLQEEKKRLEENIKQREEWTEKREAELTKQAESVKATHERMETELKKQRETVQKLQARCDTFETSLDTFATSSQGIELQFKNLKQLRGEEVDKETQRLEALSESTSLALATTKNELTGLKKDMELMMTKSNQHWSIVTACNQEVSKLEQTLTTLQTQFTDLSSLVSSMPPSLSETRLQELLTQQLTPLSKQLTEQATTLIRLTAAADGKQLEIGSFATSVNELRLRHEQFSREVDLLEIKLAEQMAQTEYANQHLELIAQKVSVELPKRKPVGKL